MCKEKKNMCKEKMYFKAWIFPKDNPLFSKLGKTVKNKKKQFLT